MSKVSDIEFMNRQLNPDWNVRAEMAKKIRDFLDVPTHTPFRPRPTPAERELQRYQDQLRGLRGHVNGLHYCYMIQSGQIP